MGPWLIAVFGKGFADVDNADAAMEMVMEVIVKHEIGGFTTKTFTTAAVGSKMELLAFTKFVFRTVGIFYVLLVCAIFKQ
jgi:hypothetical protein